MKKIEAIIRSSVFENVKQALNKAEVYFFSFNEVKGYGHQRGETIRYRGTEYDEGYIARLKLEIIVSDGFVQRTIDAILQSAKTGEVGDGKISVYPIEQCIRIRTGETGDKAI